MKHWLTIALIFFFYLGVNGQQRKPKPSVKDTLSGEAFIQMVDQAVADYYTEFLNDPQFNKIIDELEAMDQTGVDFSDEVYCERLKRINETSSYKLDCNAITLSMIRFFAKNRRSFATIVLGRSTLYFDLYEEYLNRYDLPKVLKYLSVIESGLRPQVKSPAGALGLWQFMYGTGKMYGLKDNSYIDERMDPRKSTDAACRYLKKLHGIYNDWNLALAAYNAGPGNINKAIKRSGGKRTYWDIRPFLPKETQGYVPNFIAATYLLTHHQEHKIKPAPTKTHYYLTDTICLKKGVHMSTIASLINWTVEDIKTHNPVYKGTYIPYSEPNQCLSGPTDKIGKLVSLEDSLYKLINIQNVIVDKPAVVVPPMDTNEVTTNVPTVATTTNYKYHKVKSGETLTKLARQYGISANELMRINRLKSTTLRVGTTLKIPQKSTSKPVEVKVTTPDNTTSPATVERVAYDTAIVINHIVQRNESLTFIAGKYSVTIDEIKEWNGLKDNWLSIGQKLVIHRVIRLNKDVEIISPTNTVTKPVETKTAIKPTQFYIVKSGDLFNRIATANGLTQAELQKLNPDVRPDRITVGQKLRIK